MKKLEIDPSTEKHLVNIFHAALKFAGMEIRASINAVESKIYEVAEGALEGAEKAVEQQPEQVK